MKHHFMQRRLLFWFGITGYDSGPKLLSFALFVDSERQLPVWDSELVSYPCAKQKLIQIERTSITASSAIKEKAL